MRIVKTHKGYGWHSTLNACYAQFKGCTRLVEGNVYRQTEGKVRVHLLTVLRLMHKVMGDV